MGSESAQRPDMWRDETLRLEVLGARGSTPVSGASFLRYGGNTTCYTTRLPDGHYVVIDCGSGLANLEAMLQREVAREAFEATIFFTHFHWDHILGLPMFSPLFEASTRLHIVAAPPRGMSVKEAIDNALRPPWFPVRVIESAAKLSYEELGKAAVRIGPLELRGVPLRHPGGVTGYRIEFEGRAAVIATDVEAGDAKHDAALRRLADGATLLVHDAQYTPAEYGAKRRGWGHSTWELAARAAAEAGVDRLVLTSHDPRRSDDEVDAIVEAARAIFPVTEAAFEGQAIGL